MNANARTPWVVVAVLVGAGVAVALHIGKAPGAMPLLRESFGLDLTTAGWVVSIFSLIAALAGIAVGLLADRYGQARVALAGLLLMALASALGAAAPNTAALLGSRALEGFGFILAAVSLPSLIVQAATPADRGVALGLWGTNVPLGIGLMLLLGAPLLDRIGWRGVWLVAAALTLLAAVALFGAARGIRADDAPKRPPLREQLRALAGQRGPWLLTAIFTLYAGEYLVVVGFLPLILVDAGGLTAATAATLSALVVLANVLGNATAGFALRAGVPARYLLIVASAAMGLGAALAFADSGAAAMRVAGGLLFSGLGGLIPGSLFALAPEHTPRPELLSSVNGLMMQGSAVGQFVLPPIAAAFVASRDGWSAAAVVIGLAAASVIALALALPRTPAR